MQYSLIANAVSFINVLGPSFTSDGSAITSISKAGSVKHPPYSSNIVPYGNTQCSKVRMGCSTKRDKF